MYSAHPAVNLVCGSLPTHYLSIVSLRYGPDGIVTFVLNLLLLLLLLLLDPMLLLMLLMMLLLLLLLVQVA